MTTISIMSIILTSGYGPNRERRTGSSTNPFKAPKIVKIAKTAKKYLKYLKI